MRLELNGDVQHPEQIGRREAPLGRVERPAHPFGEIGHSGAEADGQLATERIGHAREQEPEIRAMISKARHFGEHVGSTSFCDNREQAENLIVVHESQRVAHQLGRDRACAERQYLVGEREGVAHRSVGGAREHAERIGLRRHLLRRQHDGQPFAHVVRTHAPQVKALHARENRRGGAGDLLWFGCGEHEHHAWRRLLDDLQQRVPCWFREHVGFVDDVHLVAVIAGRGVRGTFAQIARIVDSAVARRVDLHHVERGRARPDALAAGALAAGLAVLAAFFAVKRHREHARERGLAGAARTAKEVGLSHPIVLDGAPQRGRHMGLYGDVGEPTRAVLAGERERHDEKLTPIHFSGTRIPAQDSSVPEA